MLPAPPHDSSDDADAVDALLRSVRPEPRSSLDAEIAHRFASGERAPALPHPKWGRMTRLSVAATAVVAVLVVLVEAAVLAIPRHRPPDPPVHLSTAPVLMPAISVVARHDFEGGHRGGRWKHDLFDRWDREDHDGDDHDHDRDDDDGD